MGLVCEYDSTLINIPNQFLGEIIHYWYRLFTFTIELLKLRAKKKTYGWGTSTLSFHSIDCTSTYKFTGRWWRGAPSRLFVFRVFQRDCLACRRAGQSAIRASSNSSRTPSPHSVETAVLRTLADRCEARLMSGCAPKFSTVLDRINGINDHIGNRSMVADCSVSLLYTDGWSGTHRFYCTVQ